jgi:hypothetical protein
MKSITNTELKLNEAKYFFNLLSKNIERNQEFDYLLNAFISSARSVTWIMKSEFVHLNGWKEWSASHDWAEEEQLLLSLMNTLRVESTKRASLRTAISFTVNIPADSLDSEKLKKIESMLGKHTRVEISETKPEETEGSVVVGQATVHDVKRIVKNIKSDEDIMELCRKYLSILDILVRDCIAIFRK